MQKRLKTADEVADFLGVTIPRVYDLARQHMFPPGVVVRIGRQVRFDEDALAGWISRGGTAHPPSTIDSQVTAAGA